jgi:tetraether lipid synthase
MRILTREEIQELGPESLFNDPEASLHHSCNCMKETDNWSPNQQMGRRWTLGCVALEITQRCNMDCSLCYLSEHSEAIHDIPVEELFRRIDLIHQHYGAYTNVQVTGGDPTLRQRDELVAIVKYISRSGMQATLMTNGIKAPRELLMELSNVGLVDVAFHVDTTQGIKGYDNEVALNTLRERYIDRAQGLGLSIMFNTTVHRGNFHEIPELVKFFRKHADVIRLVSFQLQAKTGRGVEGKRPLLITPDTVWKQLETGAGTTLNSKAIRAGHSECNRYAIGLRVGDEMQDLLEDTQTIGKLLEHFQTIKVNRRYKFRSLLICCVHALKKPVVATLFIKWMFNLVWTRKIMVLQSKGKINTMSFFMHNFMDDNQLDSERISACAFKMMTEQGPISMCLYNAKRDNYLLQPTRVKTEQGISFWHPLTGAITSKLKTAEEVIIPIQRPIKKLKGKSRQRTLASKRTVSLS